MALGKLTPQEEEPQAQSPEEILAAEQEKVRQLQAQLDQQAAIEAARREEQDRLIGQRFQQAQNLAPQPAQGAELYQAQQELEISDEELLGENAAQNIRRLVDYAAEKKANERVAGLAPVVGGLVEQSYKSQLQAFSGHRYYEDVGPLVEQFFAQNRDQLLVPGRVQSVFYEIVGTNQEELEKRASARQAANTPQPQGLTPQPKSPPLPSISTSPAVREVDIKPPSSKPALSEQEEYLMNIYNNYGADLDPTEWKGIASGKLLPKNRAADWQQGRPEDAHVTNYESREFEPRSED